MWSIHCQFKFAASLNNEYFLNFNQCLHIYEVLIFKELFFANYKNFSVERASHKARSLRIVSKSCYSHYEYKWSFFSNCKSHFFFQMKSTTVFIFLLVIAILQGKIFCILLYLIFILIYASMLYFSKWIFCSFSFTETYYF